MVTRKNVTGHTPCRIMRIGLELACNKAPDFCFLRRLHLCFFIGWITTVPLHNFVSLNDNIFLEKRPCAVPSLFDYSQTHQAEYHALYNPHLFLHFFADSISVCHWLVEFVVLDLYYQKYNSRGFTIEQNLED